MPLSKAFIGIFAEALPMFPFRVSRLNRRIAARRFLWRTMWPASLALMMTTPGYAQEGKATATLLVDQVSALVGRHGSLVVNAHTNEVSAGDDEKLRIVPRGSVRSADAITTSQALALFDDARQLATYLVSRRQLGGSVGSLRDQTLLRECEAAVTASHVAGQALVGRTASKMQAGLAELNELNTRIAESLNALEAVPVSTGLRSKVPEPANLPTSIAGPAPEDPAKSVEQELVYPWFDTAVAFLVASAGSGLAVNEMNAPNNPVLAAVFDKANSSEPFSEWAPRICRRFMFLDSTLVDYVAIQKRSITDEGRGLKKVSKVDVDLVNEGGRPLAGSLLLAVLGVSTEALDKRLDIQYAQVITFDLRPKQKQRFTAAIPYEVPKGRGIRLMLGPEIGNGPIAAKATGPAEPIGTCADNLAAAKSPDPWLTPLGAYALDATEDFSNTIIKREKTGIYMGFETGKYPLPGALKTDIHPGGPLASARVMLARETSEEDAIAKFWPIVRQIQKVCGKKGNEITRGEKGEFSKISFDYKMFSPGASLSVTVREEEPLDKTKPPAGRFRTSIDIMRHSRIFP